MTQQIRAADGLWVTSAGNAASDACRYSPAYSTYAITVGAYNSNLEPSTWFTNYGSCVDIWGPGEDVYSSFPGDAYAYASGTSMASPNVAGIVADIVANDFEIASEDVVKRLQETAFKLTNCPSSFGNCLATYRTCSN